MVSRYTTKNELPNTQSVIPFQNAGLGTIVCLLAFLVECCAFEPAIGQEFVAQVANDSVWQPWTSGSAKVVSLRPLVRDGWYNSSPSMITWGHAMDRYANPGKGWISFPAPFCWMVYRRGTGDRAISHGSLPQLSGGQSSAIVMRSHDLRRWRKVKLFEPPEGVIDGSGIGTSHLCADEERLYLFLRVHTPTNEGQLDRLYMTSTSDGVTWSEPTLTRFADGGYFFSWRVRTHDGKFYSAIPLREGDKPELLDLMISEDGITWSRHARIDADKTFRGESDLYWRADGELWCVVRTKRGSFMYWAQPPYQQWEGGTQLPGGDAPAICQSGSQVYYAGRGPAKVVPQENDIGGGTTCVWHLRRGTAELIVSFPAGGDVSSPGLISPEPGRLVITFHSDIAYQMGPIKPKHPTEFRDEQPMSDVYIAEIEVSNVATKAEQKKEKEGQ